MKNIKYSLLLVLPLLLSCFDDNSSGPTIPLSNINIESGIDSVYNLEKNDTLLITPVISQENTPKELTYTWEVEQKRVSTDSIFTFVGSKLGVFKARLIVENEDGKTFFPFIINVNSPYEEGITILSKDASGKSMISFMRKPLGGQNGSFYKGDCFSINNPDVIFVDGATDFVHTNQSLIVICQGGGERGDLPTIYYLNDKTFVVENMFAVPEVEDAQPVKLGIPLKSYPQTSYPILCKNGKVYDFSTGEGVVTDARKLQYTYENNCIVADEPSYYCILLWDKENGGLSLIYYGNGPYYCSTEYHLGIRDAEFAKKNYFANRTPITMTKVRMTRSQINEAGDETEFLIITNYSVLTYSEVIKTGFWTYDNVEGKNNLIVSNKQQATLITLPINMETPSIANKTNSTAFFADGNKVRRWRYDTSLTNLVKAFNEEEFLKVGSDNAVITGFEMSEDHKITYVAFYEPNQEGLNGSVWMFDTKTGEVLEKHDNVCYQPVKMIYKKK